MPEPDRPHGTSRAGQCRWCRSVMPRTQLCTSESRMAWPCSRVAGQGSPITDLCSNNIVDPTNFTLNTWILAPCFAVFRDYPLPNGGGIGGLTGSPAFPNNPRHTVFIPEMNTDVAWNQLGIPSDADPIRTGYGSMMTAFLNIPADGNYAFYIRIDDDIAVIVDGTTILSAGCCNIELSTRRCGTSTPKSTASKTACNAISTSRCATWKRNSTSPGKMKRS